MNPEKLTIIQMIHGRCNPDTASGVDKTVYHLSRRQASMGHDVHIISRSHKEPIDVPGVSVHRVDPWRSPFGIPAGVREIVRGIRPDVVHFHSTYISGNVGMARYLRGAGIPYVVTPHGNCASRLLKRRPLLKVPYKILLERPYINGAAFAHAVGDSDEIIEYGITVPVIDIPNGMDLDDVPPDPETNTILHKYPEWEGRTLFVFVGRLDTQQKGLDLVLEALVSCSTEERKQIGVLYVGPDWNGSEDILKHSVRSMGLGGEVKFFGGAYGSEKFDLIKSADCFIHPSRWEGMPFAVIEAMGARQLCLVTAPADPANALAECDAGVLIEPGASGIRDGFLRVVAMRPEERLRLIGRSFSVVRDRFDWGAIARRLCETYQQYGIASKKDGFGQPVGASTNA